MAEIRHDQRRAWLAAIPLGAVWDEVPVAKGSIDGRSAWHRLSLYRALLEQSGAPERLGAQGERHIFWGYAAQLLWQWQSGRLNGGPAEDTIDDASWWGAMNATLSLLPARGAQRAGCLDTVELPPGLGPLADHRAAFRSALDHWARFFERVAAHRNEEQWEAARVAGWRAHVASIEAGGRAFAPLFARLSEPERRFGRGWTRMVDFFGRAALRTDLEAIARFRSALPPRPLRSDDTPGRAPDFDDATNDATRRIVALAGLSPWTFALRRALWNRAMRDPVLRAESLDILFGDRGEAPEIKRRFRRALWPGPTEP